MLPRSEPSSGSCSALSRPPSPTPSCREGTRGNPRRAAPAMLEGKRVAVVVPAYQEQELVAETLRGVPDFVDRIYLVDDASPDETAARARELRDPRVEVIVHEANGGVGAAIVTGYRRAREERIDVTCVMAADNQMDPAELAGLVGPVARGEVDYTKANRLITGEAWT